jgi:hypothetical protein
MEVWCVRMLWFAQGLRARPGEEGRAVGRRGHGEGGTGPAAGSHRDGVVCSRAAGVAVGGMATARLLPEEMLLRDRRLKVSAIRRIQL